MKNLFISDLSGHIGENIETSGWVHSIRDHKKVVFMDLRDRSGLVQVVGDSTLSGLSPEDVVTIKGLVKKRPDHMVNPKLETGSIEVELTNLKILSKSDTLPFDISKEELDVSLPVLLDYRALSLRHPKISAIFKVQEVVIDSFRRGLKEKGFVEFQSPVLIPESAEGGSEVFEVAYFDYKAYLAQSPQFYKQIMVGVFEKVFTVNKTLRAEPSVTTRHLTEVTTLDAEMGFIDSWTEVMDMAESTIVYIFNEIEKQCSDVLKLYDVTTPKVPKNIPRIKLREAQEIIFKRTGRDNRAEPDLEPEDEREICKWSLEEKNSELVFITHYPVSKRPFYTYEDPDDIGYTLSFDLIGRGIEWMTGGQRIHDPKILVANAKKRGVNVEKSELYMQAFRYGMPPHGGFSFGSERITMKVLQLENVRQASLFPRDMERIDIHLPTLKRSHETKKENIQDKQK